MNDEICDQVPAINKERKWVSEQFAVHVGGNAIRYYIFYIRYNICAIVLSFVCEEVIIKLTSIENEMVNVGVYCLF